MNSSRKTGDIASLPRSATAPRRKVFIKGLRVDAHIGAYEHEWGRTQPLYIDIDLEVIEPADPTGDKLEDVLCYNKLTQGVQAIVAEGHIKLIETLAERISELAMAHPFALAVRVRIEKPEALAEARTAGVEIQRRKTADGDYL